MDFEDGLTLTPRPEVAATRLSYHGALGYAELERLGLKPEQGFDFSVHSNPHGPPPARRWLCAAPWPNGWVSPLTRSWSATGRRNCCGWPGWPFSAPRTACWW